MRGRISSLRVLAQIMICWWVLVGAAARGEDRYFVGLPSGGSAEWYDSDNWTAGIIPTRYDSAWITDSDSFDRVVTLDFTSALGGLSIGNSGGGLNTLYQPNGVDLITPYEELGARNSPPFQRSRGAHVQDGGTNTTGYLDLGANSSTGGTAGSYRLNAGTLNAQSLQVGSWGHGTFEQNGGTANADGLTVGATSGTVGLYTLTGGTLNVARQTVGFSGAGTFLNTGGTHVVTDRLWVSYAPGFAGGGTYLLSGTGAALIANEVYVGRGGGTFIQSAGIHLVQSRCVIGYSGGQYDLSGGDLTVLGQLDVGWIRATLNHTGGTATVGTTSAPGVMTIGYLTGSGIVYNLASASASLTVWGAEYVGYEGRADFNHSAGTHFVSDVLDIGADYSHYRLDGGDLRVAGSTRVGVFGVGAFTQTGGSFSATLLQIGPGGNFTWGGGSLAVSTLSLAGQMTLTQGSGRTLVVNTLHIEPRGAALDLTDNAMTVDYPGSEPGAAIDALRDDLARGVLLSSTSIPTGIGATRLAYADNRVLQLPSFAGQGFPAGDFTQLLVTSTFAGDTNLDGQVDMTDLASLATHWQSASDWTSGDFDYSGFTDITDLGLLATNWQARVGNQGSRAFAEALASLGLPGVTIPEPVVAPIALLIASLWPRTLARKSKHALQ